MYKSREIRWFENNINEHALAWFRGHDLILENTDSRTDHYLPLPGKEDMNVKLREGRIEFKQRTSEPVEQNLAEDITGYMENWIKWSFEISSSDTLSQQIIGNDTWLPVTKTRMGLIAVSNSIGQVQWHSLNETVASGCQVEYTKVEVEGKVFFTYGLEWFGEDAAPPTPEIMKALTGKPLSLENSFGYPAFLTRFF